MEQFVPLDEHSKANVYLRKLYRYIIDHREELGYPIGTNLIPYLFLTNDYYHKYLGFIRMCADAKYDLDADTNMDICEALWQCFHELKDQELCSCCAPFFSCSEERLRFVYDTAKEVLSKSQN